MQKRPTAVTIGAGLLALVGLIIVARVAYGVIMLLIAVLGHSVPWAGGGLAVASVAALLGLTVPRTGRDFILRRRVPVVAVSS
jgi:hypothetical protein